MKRCLPSIIWLFIACLPTSAVAESIDEDALKGWGFLAHKLEERGMPRSEVRKLFLHKHMPRFSFVPFSVTPQESKRIYSQFTEKVRVRRTKNYLKKYRTYFQNTSTDFGIPKEVIAAILLIETDLGNYTGNHRILPRLARLANAGSPKNIEENYQRLIDDGEEVTFEEVEKRGAYLLELFTPHVEASLRIAKERGFSPFAIKGSRAGAFGFPQFLPGSFEKFAKDGNSDGVISLFHHADAIYSVGSFLAHYIGEDKVDENSLRRAVYEYNRSEPYVNAVLKLSGVLGLQFPAKNREEIGSS